MRVSEHVFVVEGALRAACYDTRAGECWPLTEEELAMLQHLASGRQPTTSSVPLSQHTAVLVKLRAKGWIQPGVPTKRSLELRLPSSEGAPRRLAHVWLELTQSCNLTCSHCYAESGPTVDRTGELELPEWLTIVEKIVDYGVDTLTFIGGEPTIRLDIAEAISDLVRSRDPKVTLRMFSNFSIMNRKDAILRFVKKFGIRIGTALYGLNHESHDAMTGVKGSFDRTLSTLRSLQHDGISVFVGMYMDLSADGKKEECENWLKNLGIQSFEVIAPSQVGRGAVKFWRKRVSTNSNQKILSFTQQHLNGSSAGHNCFKDHFVVKPNGHTSPCIMMRYADYGSIRSSSVIDILGSAAFNEMSSLSKDNIEGCRECEFRFACFDCRPDAMAGTQNVTRKPACGYDPRIPLGVELRE